MYNFQLNFKSLIFTTLIVLLSANNVYSNNKFVNFIEMLAIKKSVVLGSILNETDEKKSLQFV